jgi:hypothetical protein
MNKLLLICFAAMFMFAVGTAGADSTAVPPLNWGNTDTIPVLQRAIPNDLTYMGPANGGVSDVVSGVSKIGASSLSYSVFRLSGASKTFSIGSGVKGQVVNLIKNEYDARTLKFDLTIDNPNTAHAGFSSVTFATAKGGFVVLFWPDNTTGWIIIGTSPSGVTINQ